MDQDYNEDVSDSGEPDWNEMWQSNDAIALPAGQQRDDLSDATDADIAEQYESDDSSAESVEEAVEPTVRNITYAEVVKLNLDLMPKPSETKLSYAEAVKLNLVPNQPTEDELLHEQQNEEPPPPPVERPEPNIVPSRFFEDMNIFPYPSAAQRWIHICNRSQGFPNRYDQHSHLTLEFSRVYPFFRSMSSNQPRIQQNLLQQGATASFENHRGSDRVWYEGNSSRQLQANANEAVRNLISLFRNYCDCHEPKNPQQPQHKTYCPHSTPSLVRKYYTKERENALAAKASGSVKPLSEVLAIIAADFQQTLGAQPIFQRYDPEQAARLFPRGSRSSSEDVTDVPNGSQTLHDLRRILIMFLKDIDDIIAQHRYMMDVFEKRKPWE